MLRSGAGLNWIESNGGPLLLVPGEHLSTWGGIETPPDGRHIEAQFRWNGPGEPATDYDRACDVTDYVGLVNIGAGKGLVLGGEPLSTAWQPAAPAGDDTDGVGGHLIRLVYAESEADVIAALAHMPQTAWRDTGLALSVDHEPLYLLDAAYNASMLEGNDHLALHLPAGRYAIATAEYEPDAHTKLLLHRLVRMRTDTAGS